MFDSKSFPLFAATANAAAQPWSAALASLRVSSEQYSKVSFRIVPRVKTISAEPRRLAENYSLQMHASEHFTIFICAVQRFFFGSLPPGSDQQVVAGIETLLAF